MKYSEDTTLTPPQITCADFYLRQGRLTDFLAMKRYRQDAENCRYIRLPETDEQVMEIVLQVIKPWQLSEGRWNGWVMCLTGDDTVVGEIVFNMESWQSQRAEIGYRLHKSAAGKGLCTQAAKILVNYLFEEIGVHKVVAKCDPRNQASSGVMEKLGMVKEAEYKQHYLVGDEWTDQADYGLLRQDWTPFQTDSL